MYKLFTITIIFLFNLNLKAQIIQKENYSIGERHTIHSKVLNENRIINIYLPYKYNPNLNYPVIYLLDGSANEDFIHTVGLTQFFNLMFSMPTAIVVGIENVDRKRDFTFPTEKAELKKEFPTTGGSEKFIAFIETELKPYISSNYRVTNDQWLIGQSLGGLLATEILLKKPNLFSRYIIVSPSLWWDDSYLISNLQFFLNNLKDARANVFIAVGENENYVIKRDSEEIYKELKSVETLRFRVDYLTIIGENHATVLHSALYQILKKWYPYQEPNK